MHLRGREKRFRNRNIKEKWARERRLLRGENVDIYSSSPSLILAADKSEASAVSLTADKTGIRSLRARGQQLYFDRGEELLIAPSLALLLLLPLSPLSVKAFPPSARETEREREGHATISIPKIELRGLSPFVSSACERGRDLEKLKRGCFEGKCHNARLRGKRGKHAMAHMTRVEVASQTRFLMQKWRGKWTSVRM